MPACITRVKFQCFVGYVVHYLNILTYSMEQNLSLEANRFSASQEIPRILLNPEGSLPHSQVPATWPYREPARSSPYFHIPLPEDPSYLNYPVGQIVSYIYNEY